MIKNILIKAKEFLKLNPKLSVSPERSLKIAVSIQNNKLVISLDQSVDTITLNKEQLSKFLSVVASQMGNLK